MHNSRVGVIIPAARGLNECYKIIFHIKKLFAIAVVVRLPASSLLFLNHLHRFSPLSAAHIQHAAVNCAAHCKDRSITVISYHLICFELTATFQMPILVMQEEQINLQFQLIPA